MGKLALKSANSSKEIAQRVDQAVRDAHLAVKHVSAVSQDLNRLQDGALHTEQMMQRTASAMEQQTYAVTETNATAASL